MEKLGRLLWKLWVFCFSNEEPLFSCPVQLLVVSRTGYIHLESLPLLAEIKGRIFIKGEFIYLYEYGISNDMASAGPFNLPEKMQNWLC